MGKSRRSWLLFTDTIIYVKRMEYSVKEGFRE
jgi:hypothetical protein